MSKVQHFHSFLCILGLRFLEPMFGTDVCLFNSLHEEILFRQAKIFPKTIAFNFTRLEDHQIEALSTLKRLGGDGVITAFIIICIDYGRVDKRVILYTDMKEIAKRKELQLNIKKKEFDSNTST
jgi:hypothetical protein